MVVMKLVKFNKLILISFFIAVIAFEAAYSQKAFPELTVPENFGVNIFAQDIQLKDADMIEKAGFKFVRFDLYWDFVEKEKGKYDFKPYEIIFNELKKRNIRAVAILNGGNKLYEAERSIRSIKGRAAFAEFAKAAALKFKDNDVIWEVWNEPDLIYFWKPKPNLNEYIFLLKETYAAIKKADPDAVCIGPAASKLTPAQWEELVKTGLFNNIDGLSFHFYTDSIPESIIYDKITPVRSIMKRKTGSENAIPIISSEWGYHSRLFVRSEQVQAAFLKRSLLTNLYAKIPVSIIYQWRDYCSNPWDAECCYGLLKKDYTPRKSYYALINMFSELKGMHIVKKIDLENKNDVILLFSDGKNYKIAAWTLEYTLLGHKAEINKNIKININYDPQIINITSLDALELRKIKQ